MSLFGRNKKNGEGPAEAIKEILLTLKRLARVEQNIAAFYHRCAELFPEEKGFWEDLAESEHRHSATINRLHEMITEQPGRFRPGREFDHGSIRVFEVFVRGLSEDTDLTSRSRKEILVAALEIEASAVELLYHQIVKSKLPEFTRMAAEIDADTQEHLRLIKARAAEV